MPHSERFIAGAGGGGTLRIMIYFSFRKLSYKELRRKYNCNTAVLLDTYKYNYMFNDALA